MSAGAAKTAPCAPKARLYFEDLAVGQKASLTRTVLRSDLHPFGEPDGPEPPREPANGARFGQEIGPGMFTTGLIAAVLGTRLPGPGAVYLSQSLRFLRPVSPGDVVSANVEVMELVPARRRVRLYCECSCDGRAVLEGEVWVGVESRKAAAFASDA
jgi:3-hydroxybutyryl-CoA dehydratase